MIWFDKLLHYDYPGLKNPVRVMNNAIPTNVTDYYSSYYSFDNGPVHFVILDYHTLYTELIPMDTGYVSKQLRWLADDLAGTTKLFKVIMVHNYLGVDGGKDLSYLIPFNYGRIFTDNSVRKSRDILDEIISKHGVSVVISGHLHFGGVHDYVEKITFPNKKSFVWFNIGDVSVHNESYYTMSFNANDKTFTYLKFDSTNNNITNQDNVYVLDALETIKVKP